MSRRRGAQQYEVIEHYGRGAGYTSRKTCNHHAGSLGCEKCGTLFYPKCRDGYKPFGCNLCNPGNNSIDETCAIECNLSGFCPEGAAPEQCSQQYKECLGRCCLNHGKCLYVPTGACNDGQIRSGGQYTGMCENNP